MANAANTHLWGTDGSLPVPADIEIHSVDMWLEFAVWGLVIYDEQTPWFTLIECVNILTHRHRNQQSLLPGLDANADGSPTHERQPYSVPLNTNLRHLLFRDQELAKLSSKDVEQPVLWTEWLKATAADAPSLDLSFLREAFDGDFTQFAETVSLLRSAEIEPFGSKRWTSRYLQPLGPAMLFPDVKMAQEKFVSHRLFFRRTGEVLFMMMNRSNLRKRLATLLEKRLVAIDRPWNRMARRIQGPDANPAKEQMVEAVNIGYLPMAYLPRYDCLAEDLVALLSRDAVPIEDALDHIMRMSGLNMVVYILERAVQVCGRKNVPPIVFDLAASARANPVYGYSLEQYKHHKLLPIRAIEAHVHCFAQTEEWASLGVSPADKEEAKNLLSRRFAWRPKGPSAADSLDTPQGQLNAMLDKMKSRSHDIGSAFASHARQIGLSSARQRAGTWYAPSDALLEALVLSNVDEPIELDQFLKRLFNRYHILVGEEQATENIPIPRSALKDNVRHLEERLRVLGFIDRKSDDCAFVINPFHQTTPARHTEEQYERA
jgi:hypothetical protein